MKKLRLEHDPDVFLKRPIVTLESQLKDIPLDWLAYVEPHVTRHSYPPHWWWEGRVDERRGKTHPIIVNPYSDGVRRTSYIQVRKFAAALFFVFPETHHVHMTCTYKRCVNPSHFVIKALDPRQFDPDDYE